MPYGFESGLPKYRIPSYRNFQRATDFAQHSIGQKENLTRKDIVVKIAQTVDALEKIDALLYCPPAPGITLPNESEKQNLSAHHANLFLHYEGLLAISEEMKAPGSSPLNLFDAELQTEALANAMCTHDELLSGKADTLVQLFIDLNAQAAFSEIDAKTQELVSLKNQNEIGVLLTIVSKSTVDTLKKKLNEQKINIFAQAPMFEELEGKKSHLIASIETQIKNLELRIKTAYTPGVAHDYIDQDKLDSMIKLKDYLQKDEYDRIIAPYFERKRPENDMTVDIPQSLRRKWLPWGNSETARLWQTARELAEILGTKSHPRRS